MQQVFVLTHQRTFFARVEKQLQKDEPINIQLFEQSLKLINTYLKHFAQLVILDIDVIKEDIFELIQILRSIHREAKVVLYLSAENMPICSSVLSMGITSYQLKPISVRSTAKIINSVLQTQVTHT
jgi:DNA-binding NtrC family response regulator